MYVYNRSIHILNYLVQIKFKKKVYVREKGKLLTKITENHWIQISNMMPRDPQSNPLFNIRKNTTYKNIPGLWSTADWMWYLPPAMKRISMDNHIPFLSWLKEMKFHYTEILLSYTWGRLCQGRGVTPFTCTHPHILRSPYMLRFIYPVYNPIKTMHYRSAE